LDLFSDNGANCFADGNNSPYEQKATAIPNALRIGSKEPKFDFLDIQMDDLPNLS